MTCAGHASIGTGTVPAVHGMVNNTWADSNNARTVSCTDDPTVKLISYGGPTTGVAHSAANLVAQTLADEMRTQIWPTPRTIGISLKARSAINLVGHRPDAVIWLDERDGEWVTSTAFAKTTAPFFADYLAKHPTKEQLGQTWNLTYPKSRYMFDGSTEFRRRTPHVTKDFPHTIRGRGEEVGGAITDSWEASPYSDAYLNALAFSAIDALKLGKGPGTDFLGISFSALDLTGHSYGPTSFEVQDVLIQLDVQIGLLLDKLDKDVGKGQYVVGLSADHGVAPVPERMKAEGFDAGRVDTLGLGKAIDTVLNRELGPDSYRTRVLNNDVYFNDGVYARLTQHPAAMDAVLETIRKAERHRACVSERAAVSARSVDAATVPQPLRGPQRRDQDRDPAVLDHQRLHRHPRHRQPLRHARAGGVVWIRHQVWRVSGARGADRPRADAGVPERRDAAQRHGPRVD